MLGQHPDLSCFADTGVPEDEGQHLQTVYPTARFHGGPGKFGFNPDAHITERSALVSEESRSKLQSQWSKFWDTSKPVLVEKSPPNLIRARFLQQMFPNAYFIVIVRHPIPVCLATQKWSRTSLGSLMRHWLACHCIFEMDAPHVRRLLTVTYEDLVYRTQATLEVVYSFVGIASLSTSLHLEDRNAPYFRSWRLFRSKLKSKPYAVYLIARFERRIRRYGYSMTDVDHMTIPQIPGYIIPVQRMRTELALE